jgi:hypothetical protein
LPELTEEQLVNAVNSGKVTLLTIDTNIFERYKNGLEYGLLKRLSQFHESEIQLVLSEIVYRELQGHMIKEAEEAETQLASALKAVGGTWSIGKEKRERFREGLIGGESAVEAIQGRLDTFQEATGFEIIPAQGYVEVGSLVEHYFNLKPPFGNKPDKKHEFPDAIAVASLERYAAEKDALMLVVSNDGGWREFCAASGHLICVADLGTAMSYLQRLPLVIAARLTQRFDAGELPHLQKAIEDELGNYIDGMDLYVEANAAYFYEADLPEKRFEGISYFDEPKFIVVDHNEEDEVYVLETTVVASVEASCHFTFFVTDWIDKDEVPIGSVVATQTEDMPFVLTVTIVGDPQHGFEVDEVEVVRSESSIDFDYIAPDYSEPDEY